MADATINSLRDGINNVLDANFPGVDVAGEEIKSGLEEPYFFVKLLQGGQTKGINRRYQRAVSFDIHYFGLNNRDMQDAAEKLYGVMETVTAGADKYRGSNMTHEIVDRVLHFFIDYNFHVMRQKQADTKMQTLKQGANFKNG